MQTEQTASGHYICLLLFPFSIRVRRRGGKGTPVEYCVIRCYGSGSDRALWLSTSEGTPTLSESSTSPSTKLPGYFSFGKSFYQALLQRNLDV
jgi:hypothetical protein